MHASDRFNIKSKLEHLQTKYVGTGHADLNRFEWAANIRRDSYASYIGRSRCWPTSPLPRTFCTMTVSLQDCALPFSPGNSTRQALDFNLNGNNFPVIKGNTVGPTASGTSGSQRQSSTGRDPGERYDNEQCENSSVHESR
ncbi:hypothetical protein R1sor_024670 [Riccia sorocarpa]|uniref:Uncharacterized protein n=1 Tax=Riccia sorocarpa TaxID=122646 RepID=A0ABD3GV60_9MARC